MATALASAGVPDAGSSGTGNAASTSAASASASASAATRHLSNTTASLPIVYGSIAFYLGKKADELQTHEWTLFLRGPNQHEDHLNGHVISKVVFQLHPSFAQPTRELTEPPYEVTERGWGEFEAQIRIHWKDVSEQTTIVNHTIKLYPQGAPPSALSSSKEAMQQSTEVPVLAETYDEVVFTDPTESFFRSLTQITAVPPGAREDEPVASFAPRPGESNATKKNNTKGDHKMSSRSNAAESSAPPSSAAASSWRDHLKTSYSDQDEFLALIAAQKFLRDELAGVTQKFRLVGEELETVDQKLALAQQQKQREAAAAAVRGSGTAGGGPGERKRAKKSRSAAPSKKSRAGGTGAKGAGGTGAKRGTTQGGAARAGGASKAAPRSASKPAQAGEAPGGASGARGKKGTAPKGGAGGQASAGTKK